MASSGKLTDKGQRQRALRRQRQRLRRLTEADEPHILDPVESADTLHQPAALAETYLPLVARQTLAQRITQREGNGRLQRLLAVVQRKQAATKVQRKGPKRISTPLDKDAKKLKNGSAQLTVNGVLITILPDKVSKAKRLAGQAETNFHLKWGKPPGYQEKGGIVTKVDGKLPPLRMTIQTTYGVGAKAQDASAYGRGTTEEDKAAGNTTLGFHEGRHGLDYIKYLKENPLPQFIGKVGMQVEDYKAAMEAYQKASEAYATQMGAQSKAKTDCVGTEASFCVKE